MSEVNSTETSAMTIRPNEAKQEDLNTTTAFIKKVHCALASISAPVWPTVEHMRPGPHEVCSVRWLK